MAHELRLRLDVAHLEMRWDEHLTAANEREERRTRDRAIVIVSWGRWRGAARWESAFAGLGVAAVSALQAWETRMQRPYATG